MSGVLFFCYNDTLQRLVTVQGLNSIYASGTDNGNFRFPCVTESKTPFGLKSCKDRDLATKPKIVV